MIFTVTLVMQKLLAANVVPINQSIKQKETAINQDKH